MRPGPTIASSVLSLADVEVRAPVSSVEIVPNAPLMSPTCAESSVAPRPGAIRLWLVVMTISPFHPQLCGIRGARDQRGRLAIPEASKCCVSKPGAGARSACPERAWKTADGACPGPVYRVPRFASPQSCAWQCSHAAWHAETPGREGARPERQAPLSLELWHSTA